MATFVTTSKMHPALAARIQTSISGSRRQGSGGGTILRRVVLWSRLTVVVLVALALFGFIRLRYKTRDALEGSRAALLAKVRARAASVPADDRKIVAKIEPWLVRSSGRYEGDLIADELRGPGALGSYLKRPIVYVRGPASEFSGPASIATAASTSFKDAFVLCLLEPPKERTETALLGRVHGAYGGGAKLEARTSNVRRLHEAEAGLRFLAPSWAAQVTTAKDAAEISRLEHAFARAPLDLAAKAGAARLLLFAMDEDGDRTVPAELDGERPHDVRVGLVDLAPAQGRPLLRLRKRVDPQWITVGKRAEYASGLDSCALAMDVLANAAGG